VRSRWGIAIAGLGIAVVLVAFVSPFASSSPDGLERVADDEGFLRTAADGHRGLEYGPLSGVLGLVVVFAVVAGVIAFARRRRSRA
jgi:uncharacterized membrane protein